VRIARQTESYLWQHGAYGDRALKQYDEHSIPIWDGIANSVVHLAQDLKVRAVVVLSSSGMSAATMSSARPAAPVIAITGSAAVSRKMALLWSVIPLQSDLAGKMNPNELARKVICDNGLANEGDKILLVRGFHEDVKYNTPSITVMTV